MKGLVKRTPKDKIIDRFLTLYVLTKASKRVNNVGKTKLHKIIFLSEWKMISQRMKGLNYNYIKLLHGPYSPELQEDIGRLSKLSNAYATTLLPTEKGLSIIEDFSGLVEKNRPFFDIVDHHTRLCTSVTLESLLDRVYALKHPMRPNITIGQTPLRTPILYPIDQSKAELVFSITRNDLEDLAMSLDHKIVKQVEEGVEDVKAGRLLSHNEVFGTV